MKNNPLLTVCMLLAVAVTSSTAAATLAIINLTVVTSLADSGAGSLRSAILAANAVSYNISFTKNGLMTLTPEPESNTIISFATNGVISLASPLPYVTKTVTIDGTTAPGYVSNPIVCVNFQGNSGFIVAPGASGSAISGLSLINASGAALTLQASDVQVSGNFIGLAMDGSIAANSGDGILATKTSSNNLIGGDSPITSISYTNAMNSNRFPLTVSFWQGLRNDGTNAGQYLICGSSETNGLLYIGPIAGGGSSYFVNGYTGTNTWSGTSVYGPDNLTNGNIRLVGSCNPLGETNFNSGFVWEGTTNNLGTNITQASGGTFRLISYPGAFAQYTHSTMGDLAVGNFISGTTNIARTNTPEGAYICDLTKSSLTNAKAFLLIPKLPLKAKSITAYGIWDNGVVLNTNGLIVSHPFTICGGYSPVATHNTNENLPLTQGQAYLVDYDSISGIFTHWKSFSYPQGKNFITHFEGISSVEAGVYTLVADSVQAGNGNAIQGSWVSVNRNTDGTFALGSWADLNYPSLSNTLSANSVYGNQAVGIVVGISNDSYQATVNSGFQRANVISGNGGNGINLQNSVGNVISQNYIGTDINGSTNSFYGNARNGIQLSSGSSHNLIGGQFIDSNNPTGSAGATAPVFQRPSLGNLISGNHLNGVLVSSGSDANILSGNFIGTDGSGTNALGNWFDGVDIENANGNGILGCAYYQNPFAYYNVISGNYGHGVRINNATNTFFQGNYDGIDALDTTNLPNGGDGIWVSGSSKYTLIGGVIPLGSVISGNRGNGTEISDTASYAKNFNTFGGVPSFKTYPVPNGGDGILITSTGGNNTVRTCVMSGNLGNGVEIGGNATGVLIEDTTAGTSTGISNAIPNQCNGIVISGSAHRNTIGGFNPSIETSVHASGNVGYGIAVLDGAYSNSIVNSRVGVGLAVTEGGPLPAIPNQMGGVYLDQGTYGTTVGGTKPIQANFINNNGGDGLTIISSRQNKIVGNTINTNAIGVYATGDCTGTVLSNNIVTNNTSTNYDTSTATNLIVR